MDAKYLLRSPRFPEKTPVRRPPGRGQLSNTNSARGARPRREADPTESPAEQPRRRYFAGSPEDALRDALREAKQGLLVVSTDGPLFGPEAAAGMLEESGRPVLLVR